MVDLEDNLAKTLSVFCDASINPKTKVACGGAIASWPIISGHQNSVTKIMTKPSINDNLIDMIDAYRLVVQKNATNNSGEVLAILEGINLAKILMKYKRFDRVNIYSDSKISIYGLREWCFNWCKTQNSNGLVYSSSGQPVANQAKFLEIINMIVDWRLPINFYHMRGHISPKKYSYANHFFGEANGMYAQVLNPLYPINVICDYNNWIDKITRSCTMTDDEYTSLFINKALFLDNSDYSEPITNLLSENDKVRIIHPIEYKLTEDRMNDYRSLIGINKPIPIRKIF